MRTLWRGSDNAGQSQGFSDANKSRDVDPITAAQQEATGFDGANPAYKVAIQDQPARQEEGDVEALTAVATTLKMVSINWASFVLYTNTT